MPTAPKHPGRRLGAGHYRVNKTELPGGIANAATAKRTSVSRAVNTYVCNGIHSIERVGDDRVKITSGMRMDLRLAGAGRPDEIAPVSRARRSRSEQADRNRRVDRRA